MFCGFGFYRVLFFQIKIFSGFNYIGKNIIFVKQEKIQTVHINDI